MKENTTLIGVISTSLVLVDFFLQALGKQMAVKGMVQLEMCRESCRTEHQISHRVEIQ